MDKEIIARELKTEIELFKVYSLFLISDTAGISSIIINKTYSDMFVKLLLGIGFFFLIVFGVLIIDSFIRIKKLSKH
jgi:hypothetical protein